MNSLTCNTLAAALRGLIFLLVLVASGLAQAQEAPASATGPAYRYCILKGSDTNWLMDYGQNSKAKLAITAAEAPALAREASPVRQFASAALGLTYLCSLGWEHVSTSADTHGSSNSAGITVSTETQYLLRRRMP